MKHQYKQQEHLKKDTYFSEKWQEIIDEFQLS